MKFPNLCILLSLVAACGTTEVPQPSLEVATQTTVDGLTSAILNKDPAQLATVLAPEFLAEFGTVDRDAKLATFIAQQEEGFVMAYGTEAPKVVSIEQGVYGNLLVELRAPAGEKAADERVRLKKVNFWIDSTGRVYFAGLHPIAPAGQNNTVRQAQLTQWANFDVSNSASIAHYWKHAFVTAQASLSTCSGCAGVPLGFACPGVTPDAIGSVGGGVAKGFTEVANCGGPGSCAVRPGGPNNPGECRCDGTGGVITGLWQPVSGSSSCCFQSTFSSDFWWNSGDNDIESLGFCHTGSCPN